MFPNSGEVRMLKGEVKERGEEGNSFGAKGLEVKGGETVGAKSGGAFRLLDGLDGVGVGEGDESMVDGFLMYFTGSLTGVRIMLVRDGGGELFVKIFGDFTFPS